MTAPRWHALHAEAFCDIRSDAVSLSLDAVELGVHLHLAHLLYELRLVFVPVRSLPVKVPPAPNHPPHVEQHLRLADLKVVVIEEMIVHDVGDLGGLVQPPAQGALGLRGGYTM